MEYADHLHAHLVDPVRVEGGRYRAPSSPGMSARTKQRSIDDHAYPEGPVWRADPQPAPSVLGEGALA